MRVWIEMITSSTYDGSCSVTLYVRVWIEMSDNVSVPEIVEPVTLYVRVWIEIGVDYLINRRTFVTLYVRVWIEIKTNFTYLPTSSSHPLREGVD